MRAFSMLDCDSHRPKMIVENATAASAAYMAYLRRATGALKPIPTASAGATWLAAAGAVAGSTDGI